MAVLVTGATGEIGQPLLDQLERSRVVRVLSRRPPPNGERATEWVQGDVNDPETLVRACEGADPVLHMAAVTHARRTADYFRVNITGTANLIDAARRAGVHRLVFVSSRAIGAAGGAYCHSKELAESIVRKSGLEWVIHRPAEVYGIGTGDPIYSLVSSLRSRSWVPIPGDGSARLSPVHVADVTDAIIASLDRPAAAGKTYVLAGPEEMTYLELVSRLESLLQLSSRRRMHIPFPVMKLSARTMGRFAPGGLVPDQIPRLLLAKSTDNSAAIHDLGFAPGRLEERLVLRAQL